MTTLFTTDGFVSNVRAVRPPPGGVVVLDVEVTVDTTAGAALTFKLARGVAPEVGAAIMLTVAFAPEAPPP